MSSRRLRAIGGLSTDPTALGQPESLRVADDVLLHRPGIITPRLGFGDTTGVSARSVSRRPIALTAFDGDVVVQSKLSSTYTLERAGSATTYGTGVTPPDTAVRGVSDFAQARGSLYVTTADGVQKLPGLTAGLSLAGVPTDYAAVSTKTEATGSDRHAGSGVVENVAYRYCWVSRDANGYIRRSAPSSRWEQALGANVVVLFDRLYLPSGLAAGDQLEVYRTEGSGSGSVAAGAEYYLAKVYMVTAGDVAAGYIREWTVVDDVVDAMLGAALYTNSSQGGIARSNDRPPLANCIAAWADCLWLGNVRERASVAFEIAAVYDTTNGDWNRDGLHFSQRTADTTNGSASLAAVSSVGGLKVGQYISDSGLGPLVAGDAVPASTKVASITTRVTVNNATLAGGDVIRCFNDEVLFTWSATLNTGTNVLIGATSVASASNLAAKLTGWSAGNDAANYGQKDLDVTLSATATNNYVDVSETKHGHGVDVSVTGTGQTVAYRATMTQNATKTYAARDLFFHDWVKVNSVDFIAFGLSPAGTNNGASISTSEQLITVGPNTYANRSPNDRPRLFGVDTTPSGSEDNDDLAAKAASSLALSVNAYAIVPGTTFPRAYRDLLRTELDSELVLVGTSLSVGSITVECNRPTAVRPGTQGVVTSPVTTARNRLYYSKPQEPEAVPALQFFDVGSADGDILALTPLQDALLVWKDDGLYRVTGSAPDSWTVDRMSDHRLLAAQAQCVLDTQCYAWTDRGVALVTEAGVGGVLSGPIASDLRAYQRLLPLDEPSQKLAFWAVANPRLGTVVFGAGDLASAESTSAQYVWHASTQRWSRWLRQDRCMTYDPARDGLVVSPAVAAWSLLRERTDESAASSYADASVAGMAAVASTGTKIKIAVAALAPWTPAVGDVIYLVDPSSNAVYARVTGVATVGADYVLTMTELPPGAPYTATWYEAFESAVEWQAQHLPGQGMRWEELHAALEQSSSAYVSAFPLDLGARVGQTGAVASVTPSLTPGGASQVVRVGPARDWVRAYHCYPRVSSQTAGTWWELCELALHSSEQSRRVRR